MYSATSLTMNGATGTVINGSSIVITPGGNIDITTVDTTGAFSNAGAINHTPGTDDLTNGSVSIGSSVTRLGFYGLASRKPQQP
jgi:hypothetical protein